MNIIKTPLGIIPIEEPDVVITKSNYDKLDSKTKNTGLYFISDTLEIIKDGINYMDKSGYVSSNSGSVTNLSINEYLKLNAYPNNGTGTADFWYDATNKTININNVTDLKLGNVAVSKEGHTHSYAGSSSAGGAATSANKINTDAGSSKKPVYFSNGVPVACTYSLNKTVPSTAIFTDTVYTHPSYTSHNSGLYKITVDGTGHVSAATAVTKSDIIDLGIPSENTDTVYTHPSYTSKSSGLYKITVDNTGHVSAATAVTKSDITALGIPSKNTDTVYTHPTYTAKSSGLYKITVDGTGHVSAATAVTKSDITVLGIPAQDTVYTHPSYTSHNSGLYKITVDGTGHVSAATAVTKSDITALGISEGNNVEVVDNLTSTSTTSALSANQGNTLSSKLTLLENEVDNIASHNFVTPVFNKCVEETEIDSSNDDEYVSGTDGYLLISNLKAKLTTTKITITCGMQVIYRINSPINDVFFLPFIITPDMVLKFSNCTCTLYLYGI